MKLYNDDCLNVLKTIPSGSIDLILTDCPYHIVSGGCSNNDQWGGIFNKSKVDNFENVKTGKIFKHNDIEFKDWLPECYRVLKERTHIYIYINALNLKDLWIEAEKVGFIFQQLLVWKKNNALPNRYYLNSCEFILMMRKGNAKTINNTSSKNLLEIDNKIGCKTHPTEKPVELNKIFIENSTNENELVMDLFMGSGSCGVACKELNRDFIGIEIDEKYFNIAKQRIENVIIHDEEKIDLFNMEV